MRSLARPLAAVALALCAAAPQALAAAADSGLVSQVVLAPRRLTVGSVATVDWWVEVPGADRIQWPAPVREAGPFEVRHVRSPKRERRPGDRIRETLSLDVATFDVGSLVLPGPVVRISGRDSVSLHLPSAALQVSSVLRAGDKQRDIHDIKGPMALRRPLPAWAKPAAIGLGIAVAMGLLAFGVYRLIRARREAEERIPYPDRALRDLDQLRRADFLRTGRVKDYHVRLTEIVRRYVGAHCAFDALDLTTSEVLARVDAALPAEREALRALLEPSDLVKFARHQPAPGASEGMLDAAVGLVRRTRPAAAEEAA